MAVAAGLLLAVAGCADATPALPSAAPSAAPAEVASPARPTPSDSAAAPDSAPARPERAPAPPARLELPTTGTVAPVRLAPVAEDGSLAVPDDVSELGWWVGSAPMGVATGTTLVAGHVDSAEQGVGVFAELRDLRPGDPVTVVDGLGATSSFRVSDVQEVVKEDLPEELFASTAGPRRLALVTCAGPFDSEARRYRDNLIVWAEPA